MTSLEALEIQEQRLRSIVELAPACLARVTRDAIVLAMNGAARNMLGAAEARAVLKQSLLTFATADDRERLRAFVEQGCDGKSASLELSMVSLTGDAREIEASVVALPARGDAAPTALLTFRDITGYRRLEDSVIETARLEGEKAAREAEKAARDAADREREAELVRVKGEADNAAYVATALREAAMRDAARLEELEQRLTELEAESAQLARERDSHAATAQAARVEAEAARLETETARADVQTTARAADRDRDDLQRRFEESLAQAESARAQLAQELDGRGAEIGRQQEEFQRQHEQVARQQEEFQQQQQQIARQQEEVERQREEIGRLQAESERLHAEISRLQDLQLVAERAQSERDQRAQAVEEQRAHVVEEQRQETADYAQLVAERDELKRNFTSVSAAHATEMAMAFADRAALERRVQDTEAKQRRFDAEIARLTAERDGAVRSLAESQQHEQRARRWIAHWIELERAMQIARADLQELADWAHGRNGHLAAAADTAVVARPLPGAASHHAAGDGPWN